MRLKEKRLTQEKHQIQSRKENKEKKEKRARLPQEKHQAQSRSMWVGLVGAFDRKRERDLKGKQI